MNEIFTEYSNGLYNFEQIKIEMDFIREKSKKRGKVNLKKFIDGIVYYSETEKAWKKIRKNDIVFLITWNLLKIFEGPRLIYENIKHDWFNVYIIKEDLYNGKFQKFCWND